MNNKNTIIGLLLIFGIFVVYSLLMTPSKKEMEAQKRKSDSIAYVQTRGGKKLFLHRHAGWPLNRQVKN